MPLRPRQLFGQYRIVRRIAAGGFAEVYKALDTVEGIPVALKLPYRHMVEHEGLEQIRREVRLTARLDHPNILPIKTAGLIDGQFVVVTPMGIESLEERLRRRAGAARVLDWAGQLLEALAHAHERRIIHCDLKPDNLILFTGDRLRLTDFGLAKVALRTLAASGSGTLGYTAPEQAFGRPSTRSDVFSAGLILYRMMSGKLPVWPFEWPYPGLERARRLYPDGLLELVCKATAVDHRQRPPDARALLAAFRRVRTRKPAAAHRRRPAKSNGNHDWRELRYRIFRRQYGAQLGTHWECGGCGGPVSEAMTHCPWCGAEGGQHSGHRGYKHACPRCGRGVRADWVFCPWCWGPSIGPHSTRTWPDAGYERTCRNPACKRREQLPFMRYCPWCRRKTTKRWRPANSRERCPRCGWGVLGEFWEHCPWCGRSLPRSRRRPAKE